MKQRQCAEGLDANPKSIAHHPHEWESKYGPRRCRGWFPRVSCKRGSIHFNFPAKES